MVVFQTVPIVLSQGLDLKDDPKNIVTGKLLDLQNATFQTPELLTKRNGYSAYSQATVNNQTLANYLTPSTLVSGNFVAALNNEIVLGDNFSLLSYSPSEGEYVYKGPAATARLSTQSIVRNSYGQTVSDSAWSPTAGMFAWEDSSTGGILLSIIDSVTGQTTVYNASVNTTGQGPKCLYFGTNLVCIYYDTSAQVIKYVYWNGTTLSSPATLNNDINTTTSVGQRHWNYDVLLHTVSSTKYLYLAYNSAASAGPAVTRYDTSFSQGHTRYLDNTTVADLCITLFSDPSDNIWVGWGSSASQVRYAISNKTCDGTVLAATNIENSHPILIAGVYNPTTVGGKFFYSFPSSFGIKHVTKDISGGTIQSVQTMAPGCSIASKPWLIQYGSNYIPFITALHSSTLQPTYFTYGVYNSPTINNFQANPIIAKINPNGAGNEPVHQDGYTCSTIPEVNNTATGIYQFSCGQKDNLFTTTNSAGTSVTYSSTGISNAKLDFTFTNPNTLNMASELHYGGGILSMYDGANSVEHNFHLFPEDNLFGPATSGGHLTDGYYGYQITYEWTDNLGQVHLSAPSPPTTVHTTGAGAVNKVILTLTTLRVTTKTNVQIGVYRTAVNGTVYYKVANVANDFGNSNVNYTDTSSDGSIIGNEQLYTTGGEVENISAPATTIITTFGTRVVLIPDDNPYSWWYSKEVLPQTPVEFSDLFVQNVESNEGPLTGLAQLDANLILFKQNNVYYVTGQGPPPSGEPNDFSSPVPIPCDTGCNNFKSIVSMPMGLMFQSPKGIYLLDRSLKTSYIGAPVEPYNNYAVQSATHIAKYNQVRFIMSTGACLVYDYYVEQWSIFTNHSYISAAQINNIYTVLNSVGLSLQETPGVFSDNGSPIALSLTTGWLNFAGVQGYEKVRQILILGQYYNPHTLTIKVAYGTFNTSPTYTQTTTIPVTSNPDPYQFRVFTNQQKVQTLQLKIYDDGGGGGMNPPVQGLSLSDLSIEVGQIQGPFKVTSARSYG